MDHLISSPELAPSLCLLCGICQVSCPERAIRVMKNERRWLIRRAGCTRCLTCIQSCPRDALTLSDGPLPEASFDVPEPRPTKRSARKRIKQT